MEISIKFDECTTVQDVNILSRATKEKISSAAKERRHEINTALDKIQSADCKSWKRGQVVFFGVPETFIWFDKGMPTSTCKKAIVHSYVSGKDARVWLVVDKDHGTHDGKDYGFPGKGLRCYSMHKVRAQEIGRTELSIRKGNST